MKASTWKITGAVIASFAVMGTAEYVDYDWSYGRFRPAASIISAAHSPSYRQCMRRSGGVTISMRDCSSSEFDRVDARLNANYRRVMGRLRPLEQQRLRASQRRWLASQWTMCDNLPEYEGGTLDLIIRDSCVLNELTRRTLWLGRL